MRFRAIDTFRGIAAILVILFHMKGYIHILMGNALVQKSDISVDFFFVLSGFVITNSSLGRITDRTSAQAFIRKRAYRIYPLHLFTLCLAVLLETFRFIIDQYIVRLTQPVFAKNNVFSLLAHLTLTHSLNLFNNLTWNIPSWSISSEFYVYILWAASLILFRRRAGVLVSTYFLLIAWFIYQQHGTILFTYDYGIVRCLYGFLCGMCLCFVGIDSIRFGRWSGSLLEVTVLGLTIWFMHTYTAPYSWLMPIWFAFVILIFSREYGPLSAALAHRRVEFLGQLSYSYYLNHSFILAVYDILFFKVVKLPHNPAGELVYIIACLASVHVASRFTYKYVELRFQIKAKQLKNLSLNPL